MSVSPEVLLVLKSIDNSLKELVAIARARRSGGAAAGPSVASDRELDSTHGDPVVKFDPRDWKGEQCKGLHFSQCPADFLDMLAETFDYFAEKAERTNEQTSAGKPVAPYKRKDAARARGWAARARAGKTTPATTNGADTAAWGSDDL
jgi:hypothetical protein